MLITYLLIIRKLFKFINHERDQNDLYRMNAVNDFDKSKEVIIEDEADENITGEENNFNW
ncbi:hypothetical protein KHQ81_10870 [Mycoplasmatota bacterium]|nr:hypothetical protein KHQ81_10870 [Mycoplasmatota bacterium]